MATVCGRSTYRGRGQASAYLQKKKVVRKVITLTSVSVSDRIRDLFDLDNVHVLCYISTMIEIKYWNKVPSPFLLPHPKTDRPGQIKKKKKKRLPNSKRSVSVERALFRKTPHDLQT